VSVFVPNLSSLAFVSLVNWTQLISSFLFVLADIDTTLSKMTILRGYILSQYMNDWKNAHKELQRLEDIEKLKWDPVKRRWNKKFYPVTDDDNNFIKWKFGEWARKYCVYCGKILKTVKENPKNRQSRYCTINHAKTHSTIVSRAKKRFNLKDFDILTYDKKTWKNWVIMIPSIYEQSRDKQGKLHERKIKDRVESKTIVVWINGERFPYTTKSRTI